MKQGFKMLVLVCITLGLGVTESYSQSAKRIAELLINEKNTVIDDSPFENYLKSVNFKLDPSISSSTKFFTKGSGDDKVKLGLSIIDLGDAVVRNVEISTGNPNVIRKMENELIEFGLVAKRKSGAMGDYVDFDGKGITASSGPMSIVIGCFHKN